MRLTPRSDCDDLWDRGLGHLAAQYARTLGLHRIAVDVAEDKLALAHALGAGAAINAATQDTIAEVARLGGAEGVRVTAVSNTTFWTINRCVKTVGKVTSAVYLTHLKKNIALAMVSVDCKDIGPELEVISATGLVGLQHQVPPTTERVRLDVCKQLKPAGQSIVFTGSEAFALQTVPVSRPAAKRCL